MKDYIYSRSYGFQTFLRNIRGTISLHLIMELQLLNLIMSQENDV